MSDAQEKRDKKLALFAAGIPFLFLCLATVANLLSSETSPEERATRVAKQAEEKIEAEAKMALRQLESSIFIFDSVSRVCWVFHPHESLALTGRSQPDGDLSPVSCGVARRRMAPSMIRVLQQAEDYGEVIP